MSYYLIYLLILPDDNADIFAASHNCHDFYQIFNFEIFFLNLKGLPEGNWSSTCYISVEFSLTSFATLKYNCVIKTMKYLIFYP